MTPQTSNTEYTRKQKVKDFLLSAFAPSVIFLVVLESDWVRGTFDDLRVIFALLILALILLQVAYTKCRSYIFYGLFFSLFILPVSLLVFVTILFMNWNG